MANRARKHYGLLGLAESVIGEINRVRGWMKDHPIHTCAASLTLIVFCLTCNAVFLTKPAVEAAAFEQVPQHWYYDLNTKQLFVAKSGQVAPIAAPSGPYKGAGAKGKNLPAGVRAFVYSCTSCEVKSRQFIGHLEVFHPSTKDRIDTLHDGKAIQVGSSFEQIANSTGPPLVADPIMLNWVPKGSPKGYEILSKTFDACEDDSAPRACLPPPLVVRTNKQAN